MRSVVRETLLRALLELPALVDLYRDADPRFATAVGRWLETLEQDLGRVRHPLAGSLATQRAQVLAAGDGYQAPDVAGTGRRVQRATIARILEVVEPALRQEVTDIDRAFAEPREQLAQLVAVAVANGRLPAQTEPREAWLEQVWGALPDGDGAAGIREYLAAKLSRTDRLFLLDEVLRNLNGGDQPDR